MAMVLYFSQITREGNTMEDLIYIFIFIGLFGLPILGLSVLEKYLTKKGH